MKHSLLETTIGAVVLGVALIFLVFSYSTAHQGEADLSRSYKLSAMFDNIGGLKVGDAAVISGVKIGVVNDIELDDQLYRARVTFSVARAIDLAADSTARIASESLLGGKYLEILPGGDDLNLENGDQIKITQSATNLEDLLGRFIFSASNTATKKSNTDTEASGNNIGDDLPEHP
jgi:phospholipid/cholesterol/gamma-HCH transport system substrate-binding protein